MVDGELLLYPNRFLTPLLLIWFILLWFVFFFTSHFVIVNGFLVHGICDENHWSEFNSHLLTHFRLRILLWSKISEIFMQSCEFQRIVNVSLVFNNDLIGFQFLFFHVFWLLHRLLSVSIWIQYSAFAAMCWINIHFQRKFVILHDKYKSWLAKYWHLTKCYHIWMRRGRKETNKLFWRGSKTISISLFLFYFFNLNFDSIIINDQARIYFTKINYGKWVLRYKRRYKIQSFKIRKYILTDVIFIRIKSCVIFVWFFLRGLQAVVEPMSTFLH